MKPASESLTYLADVLDQSHGSDSDWWKGYVAGLKRAASMVEVHEAFAYGESCGG